MLLLRLSVPGYAQRTNTAVPPINDHTYNYQTTHKTWKTVGWISLGAGIATTAIGLQSVAASTETGKSVKWLLPTGLSLIGASIPLFVIAHHHKSAYLSITRLPVSNTEQYLIASSGQSAIKLKIIF